MKAPAFQFYPGDFLSSPDVQIMEAHEIGAYILLLCAAWQSERPGYLPNDEGRLRRLARLTPEQWKESSDIVLGKFPVQPGGEYRANRRMLLELDKQEAFRAKQSGNGARGGRPRKPNDNPNESQTKGLGYFGETQTKAKKSSSSSSSSSSTTNVVPASKEELKANLSNDLTARLASLTDTSGEILWSESLLTKPDYFTKIARKLITAPDVDIEHYRRAMLIAAEANNLSRDVKGWQSWVSIFLTNQLQRGPLLTVAAATVDLTQPTPKNQLPPAGSDCTGRHIVLANTGDANMNRMFAANYYRDYPNAIIHTTR